MQVLTRWSFNVIGNSIRRRGWGAQACFLALVLGIVCQTSVVFGQAKKPVIEDKALTTKDGQEIKISYFKTNAGKETPVVVMLHGKSGNRAVWKMFAEKILQPRDYAVITVDLRGHGESKAGGDKAAGKADGANLKPRDFVAMAELDLDAVKKFIFEEHQKEQLNMNKLGVVASDLSTGVALRFAEIDWEKTPHDDAPVPAQRTPRGQDVQALLLLSPEVSTPGLQVPRAAGAMRLLKRPVFLAVGNKVTADVTAGTKLYEMLNPKEDAHVKLMKYEGKLHGTGMLAQGLELEKNMLDFLDEHVKQAKSEWRDRRSRIDRDK